MDFETPIRIGSLCLLLASAETLHGIARAVLVALRVGKERALKISAVTGTVIAFGICFFQVPGIGLRTPSAHLALGVGLAIFMAAFDIFIGRFLMHKPWRKLWPDFDPRTGNHLIYGLLCLCFIPLTIWFMLST